MQFIHMNFFPHKKFVIQKKLDKVSNANKLYLKFNEIRIKEKYTNKFVLVYNLLPNNTNVYIICMKVMYACLHCIDNVDIITGGMPQ